MLQSIEQFLGLLEILAVISEQGIPKEVLLKPIQALWMFRIEPLLEPATAWPWLSLSRRPLSRPNNWPACPCL
jgi:hypothetical protein